MCTSLFTVYSFQIFESCLLNVLQTQPFFSAGKGKKKPSDWLLRAAFQWKVGKRSDCSYHGVLSPRVSLSVLAVAVPVGAGVAAWAGLPTALRPSPGWLVMLPSSGARGGRRGHVLPQRGTLLPGCAVGLRG